MADVIERTPYAWGVDIRKTANGFALYPPRDFHHGGYMDQSEIYVFRNAAELAAWLLQQYPEGQ